MKNIVKDILVVVAVVIATFLAFFLGRHSIKEEINIEPISIVDTVYYVTDEQIDTTSYQIKNYCTLNLVNKIKANYTKPSKEMVFLYFVHNDVPREIASIITEQSILETGWYKSILCVNQNNLFGIRNFYTLEWCAYNHWLDSCIDYYVRVYSRYEQYKDKYEDYYDFLHKTNYAEEEYVDYLRKISWE